MRRLNDTVVEAWRQIGPNFLPFADCATAEVPLSRLLRLSLFQVSVGMAAVLLIGTLNRVMIVELRVAASLVAVRVAPDTARAPRNPRRLVLDMAWSPSGEAPTG